MIDKETATIRNIKLLLFDCPQVIETYQKNLAELNPIVIDSSHDDKYRESLANSKEIWTELKDALQDARIDVVLDKQSEEVKFWYLRTVRGILLLMRNLSASNQDIPQELLLQNLTVRTFLKVIPHASTYDEMETSIYVTALGFLHNVTKNAVIFDKSSLDCLMEFLEYPINHSNMTDDILFPYMLYLLNMTKNDDFLYYFFRHDDKDLIFYDYLVETLIRKHTKIFNHIENVHEDQKGEYYETTLDTILLKFFKNIASNESFAPYFENIEKRDRAKFLNILKLMQLTITSSDKWDKFELTAIMTWVFRIFQETSNEVSEYFKEHEDNETEADFLHSKLNISLDIICSLTKYEHVQKFILFYKGLEELISLLGLLQKELIRVNFFKDKKTNTTDIKTTNGMGEKVSDTSLIRRRVDYDNYKVKSTNFPECKLLIIEIMSMLTHNKFEIQEKIRELHGLELVLSNCVIDDNDPFIKERSIVCIRFLLEGNEKNQEFVAKLEAQKAVQDETLTEAGYEVKFDKSGAIGLAPTENRTERR
ncbi:Ctr86p NDAI_0I00470 [Naumovozyma dairenensis CBS 421]|uniref:Ataxin-10 homolog n=1 Tax=Naumovozyma dairenensis (strain ATCC 10597 / BCRC 20456 / CBS 421 / NBRC 0211 / NRRL Y-12639) TaxID=1071378 RepID=G0WFQ5_NAUDC|nr:hypothetical protein NDAI_0I00470 [Naumovozyma dairenensis CBS 421]CCD26616.1 hypothetical protein NDAI_0I00470 [Naumovozyma dairenensis CBS 421]